MGWWLMNPSTSAFMMEACGEARTGRMSPGEGFAELEGMGQHADGEADGDGAAATPRNFTFSCAAGVDPSQYPALRSVMVWPETESAVQTIPAMAITKNMPAVPETPKRSRTAEEMMMVSIVIPDTGLRAVVAMALAATDVKKKEKSSVMPRPTATTVQETGSWPKKAATAMAPMMIPRRMADHGHVAISASAAGRLLRDEKRGTRCRRIPRRLGAI